MDVVNLSTHDIGPIITVTVENRLTVYECSKSAHTWPVQRRFWRQVALYIDLARRVQMHPTWPPVTRLGDSVLHTCRQSITCRSATGAPSLPGHAISWFNHLSVFPAQYTYIDTSYWQRICKMDSFIYRVWWEIRSSANLACGLTDWWFLYAVLAA